MIRYNLSVLLAERGLNVSKVSKETGLSRITLSAMVNNTGQGLQLETLNKLCDYLKVTPADIFLYSPFNILDMKAEIVEQGKVKYVVKYSSLYGNKDIELLAKYVLKSEKFKVEDIILSDFYSYDDNYTLFKEMIEELPISMKKKIKVEMYYRFLHDCLTKAMCIIENVESLTEIEINLENILYDDKIKDDSLQVEFSFK